MTGGQLRLDLDDLRRDQPEPAALQPTRDLSDQPALHAVWFDQNQGSLQ
jgi:hypothetical protein